MQPSDVSAIPYREFLARKVHFDHACGVPCTAEQVLRRFPQLKPHQAAVVAWAITDGFPRHPLFLERTTKPEEWT